MDRLKEAIGFDICRGCIDFPKGYPLDMQDDAKTFFNYDNTKMRSYESG